MKSEAILILGSTIESAGIGGVTIHISRLRQFLDRQKYVYDFCDYKTTSLLKQIRQISCHKVVHIHASRPILRFMYVFFCKILHTKSILTIHGNIGRFSKVENLIDRLSIKLCDTPILINQSSFETAKNWNCHSQFISAFIPPLEEGFVPKSVITAIDEAKSSEKEILATNASTISFTPKGEEIYGIEFLINYFADKPHYFLCVSDPSHKYTDKYSERKFSNILFISENHSFYELSRLSDTIIRSTATDGDSLSVKEGLYLGKKVIATDRVGRPNGVVLFKYNDPESLSAALSTDVSNKEGYGDENVVYALLSIYNQLLLI